MTLSPQDASQITFEICALAPVMPVLVIEDATRARPLAEALVAGGLPALEVTLRTPAALDCIRQISQVNGAQVGAGTLITPEDVYEATLAGATFGVSPGATPELLAASEAAGLPLLPGSATASEVMALLARGYTTQKFFPAEASGGAAALAALDGPLPQVSFCPTGGIGVANASDYLGLRNVICVGGSWVAPRNLIASGAWPEIETLARDASRLGT